MPNVCVRVLNTHLHPFFSGRIGFMALLHYVGFIDDFGLLTRIHWDIPLFRIYADPYAFCGSIERFRWHAFLHHIFFIVFRIRVFPWLGLGCYMFNLTWVDLSIQKRNWPLKRDPENLSRNFLARSLYVFVVLILIRVAVVLGCPRKLANG